MRIHVADHPLVGAGGNILQVGVIAAQSSSRRAKLAVAASDWPEAGRRLGQIQKMVQINFALGWLAVACVLLVR